MSSKIHQLCPKCHLQPSCNKLFSYDGYAVTCETCGGLYALGKTIEDAWSCWDRAVSEGNTKLVTEP